MQELLKSYCIVHTTFLAREFEKDIYPAITVPSFLLLILNRME